MVGTEMAEEKMGTIRGGDQGVALKCGLKTPASSPCDVSLGQAAQVNGSRKSRGD